MLTCSRFLYEGGLKSKILLLAGQESEVMLFTKPALLKGIPARETIGDVPEVKKKVSDKQTAVVTLRTKMNFSKGKNRCLSSYGTLVASVGESIVKFCFVENPVDKKTVKK